MQGFTLCCLISCHKTDHDSLFRQHVLCDGANLCDTKSSNRSIIWLVYIGTLKTRLLCVDGVHKALAVNPSGRKKALILNTPDPTFGQGI